MKTVIVALLVLVVLSQSEALRCKCGGMKICSAQEETCHGLNDVCGTIVIYASASPNYFKGCMSSSQCSALNKPGVSTAFCCRTDLCNK